MQSIFLWYEIQTVGALQSVCQNAETLKGNTAVYSVFLWYESYTDGALQSVYHGAETLRVNTALQSLLLGMKPEWTTPYIRFSSMLRQ